MPVVQQGEEGDGFYIILDGFVQIVRDRTDGQRRVLAYLREGEYFGEISLLGSGTAWASVLTAGKCELIKIDREGFRRAVPALPADRARDARRLSRVARSRKTPSPQSFPTCSKKAASSA